MNLGDSSLSESGLMEPRLSDRDGEAECTELVGKVVAVRDLGFGWAGFLMVVEDIARCFPGLSERIGSGVPASIAGLATLKS
jgi:hypothetical protein